MAAAVAVQLATGAAVDDVGAAGRADREGAAGEHDAAIAAIAAVAAISTRIDKPPRLRTGEIYRAQHAPETGSSRRYLKKTVAAYRGVVSVVEPILVILYQVL